MDTIVIAIISVVVVLVCFAFYFQFKCIGLDARTRDAEKVATKFHNVLEATTVSEDIKKNYQSVQTRLSDFQEENETLNEEMEASHEDIDRLKQENKLFRTYYGKLIETLKNNLPEGSTIKIEDLELPELPRERERERYRYESEDEEEYIPSRRHQGHQGRGRRDEEYHTPAPSRRNTGRGRHEREPVPHRRSERGRTERAGRSEREKEKISLKRGGRRERERDVEVKERRRRAHYDDYSDDDFLP